LKTISIQIKLNQAAQALSSKKQKIMQ